MTMKAPLRQSPLHNVSHKLGATMAAYYDWEVAVRYSVTQAELAVLNTGVGLADVSWLGKLELKGPEEELQAFGVPEGEVWHLARGHLLITCDPGQEVAVSEAIAHHIAEVEAANAGNALDSHDESAGDNSNVRPEPVEGPSVHGSTSSPRTESGPARTEHPPGSDTHVTRASAPCLHVTDVTSVYTGLLLAGPTSRDVLQRLTAPDISDAALANGSCISARVAGIHTRVLRCDCDELLAFWLLVGTEYAEYAWDVIMHAGGQFGIMPVGSEAVHRARRGDP